MAPSHTFLCSLVSTSDAAVVLQSLRCLPHLVVPSAVAQYVLGPYLEDIRCTLDEALRGVTQLLQCPAHTIPSADTTPNITELDVYVSRHDVQRTTSVPHQPQTLSDDDGLMGPQTQVLAEKVPIRISFASLKTFSMQMAFDMPVLIPITLALDPHAGLQHSLASLVLRGNLDFDEIAAAPPLLAVRTINVELKATDRGPSPPVHVQQEVRDVDTPKVMALAHLTPNATSIKTFSSPALSPVAKVLVHASQSDPISSAPSSAPPNTDGVPWPNAVELDTACDWRTAAALAPVRQWQVLRLDVLPSTTKLGSAFATPFELTQRSSADQQSGRPTYLEHLSLVGETGRSVLDVIRCFSLDNAPKLTTLRICASMLSDRLGLAAAVRSMRTPMLKELTLCDYDLGAGLCEVLYTFGKQVHEPHSTPEQQSDAINRLVQSIGASSLKELRFVNRRGVVWRPVEGNEGQTSWRREKVDEYSDFRYARETARVFNQVTLVIPH